MGRLLHRLANVAMYLLVTLVGLLYLIGKAEREDQDEEETC